MSDKGTAAKKKSAAAVSIEELLTEKRWEDVRQRLKRITSPTRLGELLFYSADDPDVPDDIFRTLLSKLKGKRTTDKVDYNVEHNFWEGVCNFYRERGYKKKFKQVCHKRSVVSLQTFMEEYVEIYGTLPMIVARKTICYLWLHYLVEDPPDQISDYMPTSTCGKEKEKGLLQVSSVGDLRHNQELYSLWQKTELLIKATQTRGLTKSVQDIRIVHTLIRGRLPRVVVWMALRLYTAQVQVKDEMGRLPLHLAAVLNNLVTEEDFKVDFEGDLAKAMKRRMVELVLEFFPAGAECADIEGSHPLALLLDLEYRSWSSNNWTKRCVMALMKQAPKALIKKNGKNCMLPFMTAACIHDDNTIKARSKEEESMMLKRKLNLTYAVLRGDPSVVASGITGTSRERYLEEKLEEAHGEICRLKQENAVLKKGNSTEASQRPSKRSRCDSADCSKSSL